MALVVNDLAQAINQAIASTDAHGNPIQPTPQMKAYAQAIIDTLKAGLITNLPGSINGVGAPGGPLSNGVAVGGLVTALLPATWIADMSSGLPTANPANLAAEANASTTYLMASSQINFAAGSIQGVCTATPLSPGPLAAGVGTNGVLSGLDGTAWASEVTGVTPGANPTLTQTIYKAISNYLMSNSVASYPTSTVIGTFSAGGGPLIAGAGTGGTLS